jgi:hypothetical protein
MERKETTVRFNPGEREALDRFAASHGISLAEAVRFLLRAYMSGTVPSVGPMPLPSEARR